jgi:hypothetical protein
MEHILNIARVLAAIAMVETGNRPGLTGRDGEIGIYQESAILVLDFDQHTGCSFQLDDVAKSPWLQERIARLGCAPA